MLFHYKLGLPKIINTNFGIMELTYGYHALKESTQDRYGLINLPKSIDTSKAKVIEIEADNRYAKKVLYRIPYNEKLDLMLAIIPYKKFVKTVWINEKTDNHLTLDKSKYCNLLGK